MTQGADDLKDRILDAVLLHVAFDGWSETAMKAACLDQGISLQEARQAFPRGAPDLAMAYHRRGDALMRDALAEQDLAGMRIRDRISLAIETRLSVISDKEAVRRGAALFALPQHAADGARAVWGTADAIWTALDDPSDDINWYTKRATLSAVYAATILYWLGDDSPEHVDTRTFIARRIEDVMGIEKAKGQIRSNRFLKPFLAGPQWLGARVRPPFGSAPSDLPGRWSESPTE